MLAALSIIHLAISLTSVSFLGLGDTETAVTHNITTSEKYLEPFSPEDAIDQPFQLIDDHNDSFTNYKRQLVSLKKQTNDCKKYHKVVRGDTCYSLSLKYNVDLFKIFDWNNQINRKCTNLLLGKSYCVQKKDETILGENACVGAYYAQSGDTCYSVAKEHNISVDELYEMNPSINRDVCDNLLMGGLYCVEQKSKPEINSSSVLKMAALQKNTAKTTVRSVKNKSSSHRNRISQSTPREKTTTVTRTRSTSFTPGSNLVRASQKNRKLLQKSADLTYYWVAHPDDYEHTGESVTVKTCDGKSLGKVSQKYADALVMEGTGIVGNKIVNLGSCSCNNYACFVEINKEEDPYGLTAFGSPLRPFITIAANDINRNTKIYVPAFDGWSIPGSSKKHNGCLLVDDRGWGFGDGHIDFYVYREQNYRALSNEHNVQTADVYEGGDCILLNYI